MGANLFFVERLTWQTWFGSVFPRLILRRWSNSRRVGHCYVVDTSKIALILAKVTSIPLGVSVEPLEFQMENVRDENGMAVRLRIWHEDIYELQQQALLDPVFGQFDADELSRGRLPIFIRKKISDTDAWSRTSVWRGALLVQLSVWKAVQESATANPVSLFMERRTWQKTINGYAGKHGIAVIPVTPPLDFLRFFKWVMPEAIIDIARSIKSASYGSDSRQSFKGVLTAVGGIFKSKSTSEDANALNGDVGPFVAADYYGSLNLDNPERHSDFFFWHTSPLLGKNVSALFPHRVMPLEETLWSELKEHGMSGVPLRDFSTSVLEVPAFKPSKDSGPRPYGSMAVRPRGREATWLKKQIAQYHETKSFWSDLSRQKNIKVYMSWFKYDASHCAIADGIQEAGGVTAIYQRAYEGISSPEVTTGADISFGFAPSNAELDRQNESEIRYHVSAGYIGDHRFPLLKEQAAVMRKQLHERGVTKIVAYLDENSAGDSKWLFGHHVPQRDYGFWLEKVLAEPWFGLVIKPKVPRGLREKLGPVAELLKRAEDTGRCVIYDQHSATSFNGWYPPAAVALVSDITVHGDLAAATAGMEAALAGSPALLYDGEGCPTSPLYALGEGKVVFKDWETMWEGCREHWSSSDGVPGFGDWSPMLEELDPFRDGRAAERIGTYLNQLIQGFQVGQDREEVMAQAAEHYCELWGSDKIVEITGSKNASKDPVAAFGKNRSDQKVLSNRLAFGRNKP